MNMYIYQIFSPCQAGRASQGCGINLDSNLASKDVRSQGLRRAGVGFCELITDIWFIIDKTFIWRECNQLQRVYRWLLI